MSWSDRRVFVTGGTGFLGSWLVKSLVENRAKVIVLQRDVVPESPFDIFGLYDKVTVVHGSVEDYDTIERPMIEHDVDTVFHLAAQTIVGTAVKSPLPTFKVNIMGTVNVLEAARRNDRIKGVVVASSDKAYGSHVKLPYTEDAVLAGEYPYDVSKSCADLIAQSYFKTYGVPVGITRCGNLYGGGDLNFSRIVPGTIQSVLKNEPIIIRSDGNYMRDYFYVKDAVNSYFTLAENLGRKQIHGHAFNFGTNTPISVKDMVDKIIDVSGKGKVDVKILNQASSEIREQYLLCRKAQEMLGWKPKYRMEDALKEAFLWYSEYFSRQ